MMFLIFLLLVAAGLFTAWRLLAPEMYVHVGPPRTFFPWQKSHLIPDVEERPIEYPSSPVTRLPVAIDLPVAVEEPLIPADDKLRRMEMMISEKNKSIKRLQKELESERSHRTQFEKIQSAMDEEIQRLKNQIKALKQTKEKEHA